MITLQTDVDQSEEAKAKLSEDILNLLHSSFIIDGQPALAKLKPSTIGGYESSIEAEQVILSALRQLASIWKGLLDKKATLERTVAKLSTQSKSNASEDQVDLGINLSHTSSSSTSSTSSAGGLIPTIDFFPPKVDSFGLETIIEEDRTEDDSRSTTEVDRDTECSVEEQQPLSIIEAHSISTITTTSSTELASAVVPTSPNNIIPSSPPNIRETCSSFTQTDEEVKKQLQDASTSAVEETKANEEELKAQISASLEETWLKKEKEWVIKVRQKHSLLLDIVSGF